MISKSEKASIIRNFYIELEKLIITYKDNIVNDLNRQLEILKNNEKIIKQNNDEGLIYILKVADETYKIGSTTQLKQRMTQYNVGRIDQLPIVYVYKSNNIKEVDKCIKDNLKNYKLKKQKNNEIFNVDDEFIKDTIIYCNKKSIKLKENIKLSKSNKVDNWLIIIDTKNKNETRLYKPVKQYQRKKTSKKTSKK